MNTSRFYKKLTQAEIGQTKTHEVYIRMPNDFNYEKFFNNTHIENGSVIEVNFQASTISKKNPSLPIQEYEYRFVFFANSNKEKRIPGLGSLFKTFGVEEGDVVCLERIGEGENIKFTITFYNAEQIQVSPTAVIITSESLEDERPILSPLFEEPLQIIFYGAPGTGKSYKIDNDPHVTDENTIRTTFHPDSDYAGFVGAYKPTMENVPINSIYGESVQFATGKNGHPGTEKKIVYKYVPQAFLKAYVDAWSDLDNPHFLIIEEINRGNCAQIFGDLFQLLDRNNQGSSSYAIDADEDIAQFLREDKNGFALKKEGEDGGLTEEQREAIRSFVHVKDSEKSEPIGEDILSGKKLLLPPNLYIWATMNTSDQSLFPIDSAFKRRWNWEYVPIETNPADKKTGELLDWKFEAGGKVYSWGEFLNFINPKIFKITLSEDKQMGYFFAKPDKRSKGDKLDLISEKVFVNKVLFYLWTDVFKDFDLTEEQFVYEENQVKKPYKFTDFFPIEGNRKLSQFIEGLHLTSADTIIADADVMYDSDGDADLNDNKSGSTRDYSKYSVNGKGYYTKSEAVVEVVKALIASMPEVSSAKLLDKINSLNLSYTFVYSEPDYNYYLERSTDSRFAKRYAKLELPDGESVFVCRGSTPERMGEIINGLNITNSGVKLEKIE